MKVTKDTIMLDILKNYPQTSKVLVDYDLGCSNCFGAVFEDVETIARANEVDVEKLLEELNQLTN
jgi:hybrid cluster-associated redox disulfide protein